MLENGVSIENVSVLLGHSSVRITERHYKPWGEDAAEEARRRSPEGLGIR
jgi:integrase